MWANLRLNPSAPRQHSYTLLPRRDPISVSLTAASDFQVNVVIESGHRLARNRFDVVGPHHGVIEALRESRRGDRVGERLALAVFRHGDG